LLHNALAVAEKKDAQLGEALATAKRMADLAEQYRDSAKTLLKLGPAR
jgi:hypothetical protein